MSNKASDQLHRLIHSMSKAEKRYFKVFSSRHVIGEESNYQILFDAIERMEEYDEEKLLKKFARKPFVRRFSITKNRLYNAVLRSLDAFHSQSSLEAQMRRQIHSAEILYHKSLYDQSQKILEGAKKQALRYGLQTVLYDISQWEKRIIEKNQYEGIPDEGALDELNSNDRNILEDLGRISELWHIKSSLFMRLYRNGKSRSPAETGEFRNLIEERLNALLGPDMSPMATYLTQHIRSALHFGTGEYELSFSHLSNNLKLIESNPDHFSQEPSIYLSVLTNAMYVSMRIGRLKESYRLMDKLRAYRDQPEFGGNEDFQIRLFAISYSAELALLAQSGEFDAAIDLSAAIEEGLEKYDRHISSLRLGHLCLNMAVCYFGAGRLNESTKWLNRLLNGVSIDKARDIHCMAQIISLIVHLELGNDRLIPYLLRSVERFLETRNKAYRLEEVILNFIRDSQKKRSSRSIPERYAQLSQELELLRQDDYERNAFEYFDFLAWAQSKATGKTYREIVDS